MSDSGPSGITAGSGAGAAWFPDQASLDAYIAQSKRMGFSGASQENPSGRPEDEVGKQVPNPVPSLKPPDRDYGIRLSPGGQPPARTGTDLVSVARQAARQYGVPEEMFLHQIHGESSFNPVARNSVGPGHVGIAQFDPQTAASYQVNRADPISSLFGAAKYMADLRARTGDWPGAMRSYLGATTAGGLQNVLATNPSYAAAYSMASGGPEVKYTGAPAGWRSGLRPGGSGGLDFGAAGDLADTLASPGSNGLVPKWTPPPATAAGPPAASPLAMLALLGAGTHTFVPVHYDPFSVLPAASAAGPVRMPLPSLDVTGATRPQPPSSALVKPSIASTEARKSYLTQNPGLGA